MESLLIGRVNDKGDSRMTGEEYILSMSYELDSVLGNLLTWFFFSQLCGVTSYPHPTYETTEAHRP